MKETAAVRFMMIVKDFGAREAIDVDARHRE